MTPLRIVFMGTPDFAVPALAALLDAGHRILAVYCQPPRPAGRGQKPRASAVQRFAEARGLAVHMPKTLRRTSEIAAFRAYGADLAVVAAYGLILPVEILAAPRLGCLNIHASLLPRWRGAAPVQRALLAGDAETGISIMQMDAGLDTGPVLLMRRLAIAPDETAGTLHDRLSRLGAEALGEALEGLVAGRLVPVPQPEEGVCYAAKIDKAESRIDWSEPAEAIARKVRAFNPYPVSHSTLEGRRLRLLDGRVEPGDHEAAPGTALDDRLLIACGGRSAYRILRLQREGRGPMDAASFLRGHPVPEGTRLG
ncbi:MAG: methionyl-tRNA formyltransferase [Rhodothalassiaceae bacterium]